MFTFASLQNNDLPQKNEGDKFTLPIFWWGVLGSFAIEVLDLYLVYQTGQTIPSRFKKVGFYFVRTMLMGIAGGIVVAYDTQFGGVAPLLAIHLGASTPIILQNFAQTIPKGIQG